MSLRNFCARRGVPREIFSDNGTNFRGASVELAEAVQRIDTNLIASTFTSSTTRWHFNPPSAPHMGGSWERMIRSVKTILHEVLRSRLPSDEVLRSSLIEIESIINSRPLTYVPLSSAVDEALTPNHLLLGSSNGLKPLLTLDDTGAHFVLRKNWMLTQQISNLYWKRWIKEVLPDLTRRTKWYHPVNPIKPDDIVIIVDDTNPRNCWPKGRVIRAIMGPDGQTRRAVVQTSTGIYERPVVKLAVLDLQEDGKSIQHIDIPGGSVTKVVNNNSHNPDPK